MVRKKDPALLALLEEQGKTTVVYERWFSRLKRAFTRMDKAKKKLVRIAKKIKEHEAKETP